jgi:hypothetical protein
MAYTESDLSATVKAIREIVASDDYNSTDEALAAIASVIGSSKVTFDAEAIKARFVEIYYPSYPGTQLMALELALGTAAASSDLKYLAAARIFSADDGHPGPDGIEPEILAICNIILDDDDDDGSHPAPKPRWIIEWGLRRRQQYRP